MDPLLPADTDVMEREADKDARRKIQFSVPSSVPTQLDPLQVEMIRRRRPTPATLFRLTDPPSPEEEIGPHQWVLGENGALKAKLVHTSTYQPPSLKGAETAVSPFWIILDYRMGSQMQHAVQRMALAHLASLDISSVDKEEPSSGEEEEEREKGSQQTVSATDLRMESKLLREQCALPDSLTGSADRSRRHGGKEKANVREGDKGE